MRPVPLFEVEPDRSTDDWYSPPWLFEAMGETFDLDPAAPPGGVPWIPAVRSYCIADDGLARPWGGFVWLNPPYSAPKPWSVKWAEHANGLLLLRADLSTGGAFVAFQAATSLFVPRGRLAFVNGFGGRLRGDSPFSSILLGVGDRADRALPRLADFGISRELRGGK